MIVIISEMTAAAFDLYMENGMSLEGVIVDSLTAADRRSIARAYGWDSSAPMVLAWIGSDASERVTGPDYEGAILDRQDARDGDYL